MSTPEERTGVLVVRIWTTDDDPPQIRARVTRTTDVTADEQVVSIAGSIEEVEDAVRAFLVAFVRKPQDQERSEPRSGP